MQPSGAPIWSGKGSLAMSYELKMKLLMHLVCIAQWGVFALIHWEMLGKGKWKHPFTCTVLALCGMLVISLWIDFGFFNAASIAFNVLYLLVTSAFFGGTIRQKLMSCMTNGVVCLLTENTVMNSAILNTHNPLLDALLSKKYEEAARKGVMMYFDLSDLKDIPLDRTHLVIVVSNLLNNAIEAAAQAAPPEVHVRMKKTEGELVISVRNRVRQNVEIPEGQLPRSTKREPGHGMGLANVCAVLEAHNAEYTLSCRDNWFRFTCAFPTNGI